MKIIHFDGKGPVFKHYFFWQPWGCMGCLGKCILFMLMLFLLLLLLSQVRSCSDPDANNIVQNDSYVGVVEEALAVPPFDDSDIIDDNGRHIVANRLNVIFKAQEGADAMQTWTDSFKIIYPGEDYSVIYKNTFTKLMSVQVPPEQRDSIKNSLPEQISSMAYLVFEEEVMETEADVNDPFLSTAGAWYIEPLQLRSAWEHTMGDSSLVVAVVDSYFDLSNPDLEDKTILSPYNVSEGSNEVSLPDGYNPSQPDPVLCHGTMVSTLAVGEINNGHGSAGIAPACALMPISLGRRFGSLAMLEGLLYAINQGASVINISAGLSLTEATGHISEQEQLEIAGRMWRDQEEVWDYVYSMADQYNVSIVWAAGNDNIYTGLDPSKRSDSAIRVAAVGRDLHKASFSNWCKRPGRQADSTSVSAPGVDIYGEVPRADNGTAIEGTSFSAPIVAGAVALVKSIDPTLSTKKIASLLTATHRRADASAKIGPMIAINDALKAVEATLLPFDDIKACVSGNTDYPRYFTTTLQYPFQPDSEADTTALRPLIRLDIEFTQADKGNFYFRSNLQPESPWHGRFSTEGLTDGGSIALQQLDEAVQADSINVQIPISTFVIAPDSLGRSVATIDDSRCFPDGLKFFIKKANN